jgi:hypothetical protein
MPQTEWAPGPIRLRLPYAQLRRLHETCNFLLIRMESPVMVDLKDIQSLTEFQRKSRETIARLKKTGRPAVLTVNGQAEIVVQDAASYQRLLARAEEADKLMDLRSGIADYRAGRVRDVDEVFDELEDRYLGRAKRARARTRSAK